MISIIDALTLVRAKLHTKKVLLGLIIVVSSLLFAVLTASGLVFKGAAESTRGYLDTIQNGRYLVKSSPVVPYESFNPQLTNPSEEMVADLERLQAAYVDRQRQAAEDAGLKFNKDSIPEILIPDPYSDVPGAKMLNSKSPVLDEYVTKLQAAFAAKATNKVSDLKQLAASYGASDVYQINTLGLSFLNSQLMLDGKEDIPKLSKQESIPGDSYTLNDILAVSVQNSSYTLLDDSLVQQYILPQNEKRAQNKNAIPVIVTMKEAATLFGDRLQLSPMPDHAAGKVEWQKELASKINGATYQVCWRNDTDKQQVIEAARVISEMKQNSSNDEYQKPALVYDLPKQPCGSLSVKTDSRSAETRKIDQQMAELSRKLGIEQRPRRQVLTFQIVGVMPVTNAQANPTNVKDFTTSLFAANFNAGAIVPKRLYESLPPHHQARDVLFAEGAYAQPLRDAGITDAVISFSSINDARRFIEEQGCESVEGCSKRFALTPYGTNYLLVDDLQASLSRWLSYLFLGGAILAAIVIWFMMARVIMDSRRETAVFRALGAKRIDIALVYFLYSAVIAMLIALAAIVAGWLVAVFVDNRLSGAITAQAQAVYGASYADASISLLSFDLPLTIGIVGLIFVTSFVAVVFPLLRNIRRNPIRDMRNDT